MTPEQAKDEILRLRGLFPSITPEQGKFWKDELQKYTLDDVHQVVDEHFQRHEFFNSAQFAERLRAIALRRAVSSAQESMATAVKIKREWDQIEQAIAEMSDEYLAEWQAYLLPTLPDGMRRMIEGKDPRRSATWKGLIFAALKKQEAAV